ncbi:type VI secretion system baseplate subunit TssF [Sedimentisphaera salicampi]|uniref:Type VI secretion protein, family n=1 Tax=Sedimentisphaera salicampi TaxID=1941349 RepID=A0A1W6LMC5_9BACT|nr:type VI secretion system baseplate subunit TssF [Sedimentisphaera salicampi]ARN56929.1 type VI secretion protein, family [Sedimentisphaera salicampi]
MNKSFLETYEEELNYIRKDGSRFSKEYPSLAQKLGTIEEDGLCSDPFVERLLEGFAFLSARVQHRMNKNFDVFAQSILQTVNPFIIKPVPASTVAEFTPDYSSDGLDAGFRIPKNTSLLTDYTKASSNRCEFRTTEDTVLWPFNVAEVDYVVREIDSLNLPDSAIKKNLGSAAKVTLQMGIDVGFETLPLESLKFYLGGNLSVSMKLMEMFLTDSNGVVVRNKGEKSGIYLPCKCLRPSGFDDENKLFPYDKRVFSGYRLLQEYFTLLEKFMFIEVFGLSEAFSLVKGKELEMVFLFGSRNYLKENSVSSSNFKLYCAPAVNLFPKKADRINVGFRKPYIHILPERMRPRDFEIYDLLEIKGYKKGSSEPIEFLPYSYGAAESEQTDFVRYYSSLRSKEKFPLKRKGVTKNPGYKGSEVYIHLVDSANLPWDEEMTQLGAKALCSNRDLPFFLNSSGAGIEFSTLEVCPATKIKCASRVSMPCEFNAAGDVSWLAVNFLTTNYLSFNDTSGGEASKSLRELLGLYNSLCGKKLDKHVEGLEDIRIKSIVRRFIVENRPVFLRGIEVEIVFLPECYKGSGFFLLGLVLANFMARYVSLNSFIETALVNKKNDERVKCAVVSGQRKVI